VDFNLQTKLARMEKIRQKKPVYRQLLDFYEKLYIEKERCCQSLKHRYVDFDEHLIQIKLSEGFPILDKNGIALDMETLEGFFHTLLRLSRERNPDAVVKLENYFQEQRVDVRSMIQEMWEGKLNTQNWKENDMGDPTLLFFLLVECVKPVYEYFARTLRYFINEEKWKQGYCPVCGEASSIAETGEEKAKKHLFCVYCEMDWPFPVFKCPFCNNEEEEGIKSLYLENDKQYRIEVCRNCEKYIKVIDTHILGHRVPLDVENIVTLHLDILAQKEGYKRGAQFLLLI